MKRKALFLDRDGVINLDKNYVAHKEDFDFIHSIFPLLREAISKEYALIIITNQSGIGRDYYTEDHFHDLMKWACEELKKEGIFIHDIFYCPYHPDAEHEKYKVDNHEDRKPNAGMILKAASKHNINLSQSLMIGDHWKDIQAAKNANLKKAFLYTQDQIKINNPPQDLTGFDYQIIQNFDEVFQCL